MADSEIKLSLSGFDKKVKFNLNESNETELIGSQSNLADSSQHINTNKQQMSQRNKRESLVLDPNKSSSAPRYSLDKEIASKVGNPN